VAVGSLSHIIVERSSDELGQAPFSDVRAIQIRCTRQSTTGDEEQSVAAARLPDTVDSL
jgi:hypothetical protein